jgi:hypothetical protein
MLLITIALGLAARFAPLGLPWFWSKYLGSMLWAAAPYWLLALLLPRMRSATLAALSAAIAILVELSRLVPERHIDHFRLTLAGRLLLGRYFSIKNIAAYVIAITLAAVLDMEWRRRFTRYLTPKGHPRLGDLG